MVLYQVVRCLKLVNDSVVKFPVALYEHKEDAEASIQEVQNALIPILKMDICLIRGESVVPMGVPVGQYMADLGVVNFRHEVHAIETQGKVQLADHSPIVLS
jgi:hypothetical protein